MNKEKWVATTGRILSTNIIEEDSSGSQNSSISYVVNVVWEYKVEGKWFKAESKGWGTGSYSRKKEAMAKLEQYATGLEKDVYYNPEKHYESVFELKSGVLADTSGKLATCIKGLGLGLLVGFVLLMLGAILELQFLIITAILSPIVVYIWYFRSNYQ
jgi:hypothetical protein